jgi:putative serine protease PepD
MDSSSKIRLRRLLAGSNGRSLLRATLLPAVVVLTAGLATTACSSATTAAGRATTSSDGSNAALQSSYESVVSAVLPSVVQISTSSSTGSGVVYNAKGDIVTNYHVVGSAKTVELRPATSDTVVTGDVIGSFPPDDLAVIRATKDVSMFKPATFANSEDAKIGEIVLAMGNPLGLTDSVTQGIVSATGRTVGEPGGTALITDAIQTSAAINPGNSGGALVDLSDQVVGIPTLAARLPAADEGGSGGAAPGIGFAIPSNTVRSIATQLIDTGKVTDSGRASLDITAETVANASGEPAGVGVVAVKPGGSADRAGIRPGDLITAIDGTSTPTVGAMEGVLAGLKPGERTAVKVSRNGTVGTVHATLGTLTS